MIKEISKKELQVISIRDMLEADEISRLFKKNVDAENSFGVTKALMDRLNYLPELLDNSKLIYPCNGSSMYKVSSTLLQKQNSDNDVGTIGLEYALHYAENITPEDAFLNYITEMQTEALKVFLAYWAYANRQGSFLCEAHITDIMELSSPDRGTYFTTKEKRRFWYLSQLLESTYLTITIKHKKKWITVKHPLLRFEATESDEERQETNLGYPNKTIVRVLDPDNFKETANLATEISKKTLNLASEDIMLALTLQIRASQRRDSLSMTYNEEFLMQRALLQKTKKSNPRVARSRVGKKLERLKKANAIVDYKKDGNLYVIKTRKNNQKVTK